jgi:hypothetical protein
MKRSTTLLSVSVAFTFATMVAHGQIAFQAPVAVTTSDGSQISTMGTFVDAVGVNGGGNSAITVNGMPFNAIFATAQQGDAVFSFSGAGAGNNGSNSTTTPFNAVNNGVAYVGDFSPADTQTETVTINGLTLGNLYQLQVFNVGTFDTTVNGANSQNIVGAYTIGDFAATSMSQTFTYSNHSTALGGNSGIGGVGSIELRDVTSVPEPSTYALMGLGLAAALLVTRSRKLTS